MPNLTQISAIILAGGEGRRMGGQDKGLINYQGKPLIEHVLNALPLELAAINISANRNQARYSQYAPVVEDLEYPLQGPLAGIYEAMKRCQTEYLLCLPCDTPHLPDNLIPRLYAEMQTKQVDVAIATTATRSHFVISLMKCSLLDDLKTFLDNGQRRVGLWLQQQSHCEVMFPTDNEQFINVNHLHDIEKPEA
ncbi:MAG: molybdenum cofactor guanylyltransferase [Gammaproteobacteria bacterium]|nr:molybdenum cofactor guanylyltransferase [Gammaproteobacteria bacterium]